MRLCAQYVTKQGQRVACDRPCLAFYCGQHGGWDAHPSRSFSLNTACRSLRSAAGRE